MDVLWAPWRMTFITAERERGCIFCTKPRRKDPRESLVLAVTAASVVMLNKFPYNNAHLMVAPRRHTADLDRLTDPQRLDLFEALRRSIGILKRALRPDGLNVGLNLGAAAGAGVADHLHWHVVPRWFGDTNFMPVVGEVRVMPQHLLESYDRLRPLFAVLEKTRRRGSAPRVAAAKGHR